MVSSKTARPGLISVSRLIASPRCFGFTPNNKKIDSREQLRAEESRLRGDFEGLPHHALSDARSQARLFLNLAKELGCAL